MFEEDQQVPTHRSQGHNHHRPHGQLMQCHTLAPHAVHLQDDKVSPRQAYEEMLSCVDDVIKYHENHYVRARQLRDLMTGYGERNLIPDRY